MASIEKRFSRVSDPVAAMIFFAPEAVEEYRALGLNWHEGYFCSRSAALGHWTPEIVESTFFNFFPGAVRRAVEGGRAKTTPDVIAAARFRAAGAAMRRMLDGSDADIGRATQLQWALVDNAPHQGRPLYAAHLAEPRSEDPFESLWQSANLMREFRGDGHVSVLVAHGLSPVEALVLHAGQIGTPRERFMTGPRDWPAEDVQVALAALAERGFVDGEALTPSGKAFRDAIEDETDAAASAPFRALPSEAEEAIELLGPIRDLMRRR